MELRQLRYFVTVAEELHFRRAADRLNITQAPLSVAIQNLEREIGGKLFHRTQRRVALTEVGIAFRDHALDVLARVDQGLSDVQDMVAGNAGQLRIGFTAASSLLSFFPQIVCSFRMKFPKVQVTLRDLSSSGQIAALQARELDIGIIRMQGGHQPGDISFTRLLEDRLAVALHEDHPLARHDTLRIADLRDHPLIFYPRRSGVGIYEQFMKACAKRNFVPVIAQEAADASTMIGLAATGLGAAVVPPELECIRMPNLLFKPLADDDAITELLLACRAGEANALVASFRHMTQAQLPAWKRSHEQLSIQT